MDDLRKVNSLQLYSLWRNLTIGLVTVVLMFALSKLLPGYMSPVVSLLCAAGLYTFLYNQRMEKSTSCALVPYVIFYCLIVYSFVSKSDLGHRLLHNRAHSVAEGGEMCPDGSPTTLASGGRRFMADATTMSTGAFPHPQQVHPRIMSNWFKLVQISPSKHNKYIFCKNIWKISLQNVTLHK